MAQAAIGAGEKRAVSRSTAKVGERYEVLDSWRGICALLVALFHFPVQNGFSDSAFLRSSYLFVDFFFVLSGFVIANGYGKRLGDGKSAARFVFVRFGRLYPLHIFMLGAFVGFELLRLAVPQLRNGGVAPFAGADNLASLVENIFLIHGLGFAHGLSWNSPSWSISTEFFAYMSFALVMLAFGARAWLVLLAPVVLGPIVLLKFSPHYMDATWDYGFVRCLYGFSLGVLLCWSQGKAIAGERLRFARVEHDPAGRAAWTITEVATLVALFAFVSRGGDGAMGIAAPFVFAFAINVFAHERGLVSDLLKQKPFLWLGALSYSIYLTHIFVQSRMINAGGLFDRVFHISLIGPMRFHGDTVIGFASRNLAIGCAITAVMVCFTLMASWFTWRFIEMPSLARFRGVAKRL
ncbi:MAG TPA: acyltransferase [Rhizobiaceae bacterium]|nr:acyltransferase [Rhizobiaceae bacterium]